MQVAEYQIDVTLPADSVVMLIAQPFLEFVQPLQEPFPLSNPCNARLLQAIDNVFDVAQSSHPHFIVFPEFSIPGLAGAQRILLRLMNPAVASPAVVIAGLSGLSRNEYEQICNLPQMTTPENTIAPASVPNGEWINTSITFVKTDRGAVSAFLQPKISPSWVELNTHHRSMFRGSIVRVFQARFQNHVACRFFSLH